ncbi:MAG TPA: GNAT family N-acetyltransferase [Acidimicrobiales bacterium]|nr:GNAT family N-acetyltransferase [Acidimicrobiales bacterium]
MAEVKKATGRELPAMVSTLSDAFSTDPLFSWIAGRRSSPSALAGLFGPLVGRQLPRDDHEVHAADDGRGVAVWYPPDGWKVPPSQVLSMLPSTVASLRAGAVRLLRVLTAVEKVHPPEPHYYLEFLAVHPSRQGGGLGSALLEAMTQRCDEEGLGAYLENSNPRNTPLYARFGFTERGHIALPAGAPPILAMWRDPR